MGLFGNNNRSEEEIHNEKVIECQKDIENHNFLINIEYAIGVHGEDEIVAGAMIGETGKLIAMNNYGKLKWASTTIQLFVECIRINYDGTDIYYDKIIDMEWVKPRFSFDKELTIQTSHGNYIFRCESTFMDAIIGYILGNKENYLQILKDNEEKNELEKQRERNESKVDRLLELGKMYENGLLSKEEFMSMKETLLEDGENNTETQKNICGNCGAEISNDANFCTECGNPLN